MIHHIKYPKIENSYQKRFLDSIRYHVHHSTEWVAQEKIHGANLQIHVSREGVAFGSRNKMLDEEEVNGFYSLGNISDDLKRKARDTLMECYDAYPDDNFTSIIIYGEIYGGHYNHPDVPKKNGAAKVQGGISYTPETAFCAFDLVLVFEDNVEQEDGTLDNRLTFLPVNTMMDILNSVGMPVIPIYASGTLDQMLEIPNDKPSTIHHCLYNYPKPTDGNRMEGLVLRPMSPLWLPNGKKVILKNKNEQFAEIGKAKKPKLMASNSPELTRAIEIFERHINLNRLNSAMSKVGSLDDPKNIGPVMGEVIRDVLEDMQKDFPGVWSGLCDSEIKSLKKQGSGLARRLVLENRP